MTRGNRIVCDLVLALVALGAACTHLAVPFAGAVITRLLIAGVVVVVAWWIIRDTREID